MLLERGSDERMPVYLEAEEPDGTAYRWVIDSEALDRVVALLGEPETIKV